MTADTEVQAAPAEPERIDADRVQSCCSPVEQASCCEPEAKTECCAAPTERGCGCR